MKLIKLIYEFIEFLIKRNWIPILITAIISFGIRILVGIAIHYEFWIYTNDMVVWDRMSFRNAIWGWLVLQTAYWSFTESRNLLEVE